MECLPSTDCQPDSRSCTSDDGSLALQREQWQDTFSIRSRRVVVVEPTSPGDDRVIHGDLSVNRYTDTSVLATSNF